MHREKNKRKKFRKHNFQETKYREFFFKENNFSESFILGTKKLRNSKSGNVKTYKMY